MEETHPTRPRILLLPAAWWARQHLDDVWRPHFKPHERWPLWTWPLGRAARPLLKNKVYYRVVLQLCELLRKLPHGLPVAF